MKVGVIDMVNERQILDLIDAVLGKHHVSCGDWRDDRAAIEMGGEAARRELVAIGAPAVPYLLPHVDDIYISWVLRDIGDAAVDPLIEAMEKSPQAKKHIIRLMGDLKTCSPAVNDTLLPLLSEGELDLRILAAQSLGNRREHRAFEPMITLLGDIDRDEKQHPNLVLFALGDLGDRRAVPRILIYLEDVDPMVRLGAAKALGQLGDRRAVEPLIRLLEAEIGRGSNPETHSLICELADALGMLADRRAIHVVEAAAAHMGRAPIVVEALDKLKAAS
ncbi:MAG: HEAT repeat domain-containing protein [Anaerolineae bacterium]|nr:HEAT repeat domain-containing protein [Anaerolineae bacterium]